MNKRITNKFYKRKFQIVFAEVMSGLLDRHIKPSRVRLSVYLKNGEGMCMIGKAQGTEMKLRIFADKEKFND
ncbi:MAG: hypothetical protein IIY21_21040 [Clostridiales bacterium]|nr:hypothetical protein [Clostridiales bacterium]MBQ1571256.1 hypothetical protein [Clostridiales bacterium]